MTIKITIKIIFDLVDNPKNPEIIADTIKTVKNYFLTIKAISYFSAKINNNYFLILIPFLI